MFRVSDATISANKKQDLSGHGVLYLQVFANLSDGIRPVTVEVDSNENIAKVKQIVLEDIQETLLTNVDNYRLIYKGVELQDQSILSDYGIKDWEVLDFYQKCKPKESNPLNIFDPQFLEQDDPLGAWKSVFGCILQNICIADDTHDDLKLSKMNNADTSSSTSSESAGSCS